MPVRLHGEGLTSSDFACRPGTAQINSGAIHAVSGVPGARPRPRVCKMRRGTAPALTSGSKSPPPSAADAENGLAMPLSRRRFLTKFRKRITNR
ncbi:hypothetical protein CKF42_20285 [Pantoea sp. ARC270]|nr:hypothetical protein CKF42_20285 [Pantoea sp. ARC270]